LHSLHPFLIYILHCWLRSMTFIFHAGINSPQFPTVEPVIHPYLDSVPIPFPLDCGLPSAPSFPDRSALLAIPRGVSFWLAGSLVSSSLVFLLNSPLRSESPPVKVRTHVFRKLRALLRFQESTKRLIPVRRHSIEEGAEKMSPQELLCTSSPTPLLVKTRSS